MDKLDEFLSKAEQKTIEEAIAAAEARTSGEIKVHIEPRCKDKAPYERAVEVFQALRLHETRARNAVLLYLASEDRRFSFIGDVGIHTLVGDDFWREAAGAMTADFKRGAFCQGLVDAVGAVGERLAQAFPPEQKKDNQLSDEISTDATLPGAKR